MAKGTRQKRSVWDKWVEVLQEERCRFRMRQISASPILQVLEYEKGKKVRQFSSVVYRKDSEKDIENLAMLCRRCHETGEWDGTAGGAISTIETWPDLAQVVLKDVRARIAREGSRKNIEGHLGEMRLWRGQVTANKLFEWGLERDPVAKPSAFRNRIDTISAINKAKWNGQSILQLDETIKTLKALKPTGAKKKELELRSEKIRAIPTDRQLEKWLDGLEGMMQWTLALCSAYGLRPSEAWHAEGIDEDGWIVIPGDGKTKTMRHIAPAVPSTWVKRYHLRENFEKYQRALNARWTIRWADRDGIQIPVNNSQVSDSLRKRFGTEFPLLRVEEYDNEWVRPYDLRHSYAIRCFTNAEVLGQTEEDFARWMGHGVDVHKRVYLKFMTETREDEALKARFAAKKTDAPIEQESPTVVAELPENVLEQLEELKRIKQAMGLA